MPLPAAILLDLDDTLLLFDAVADLCWQSLCGRYAAEVGETQDRMFSAILRTRKWYWSDPDRHREGRRDLIRARRDVVALALKEFGIALDPVAHRLADDYSRERLLLVKPFPGAVETLQELRNRGVELALVTNGDALGQRAKIERFGLARHFACIVIEEEFGMGKPDEAVFRHALQSLGKRPEDAWMVGNSWEFDVAPALKLGMRAILIDSSSAGRPATHHPDGFTTVSTIAETIAVFTS